MIDVQFSTHRYESDSDFRELFCRMMEKSSSKGNHSCLLKAACFDTPLGTMIAISDEKLLYMLEFINGRVLEQKMKRLRQSTNSAIIPGDAAPIYGIKKELELYFKGKLKNFKTPLFYVGSDFQKKVWKVLEKIPYGQTRSYGEMAKSIENPLAYRAVARANSTNRIAIVIPCHRVINAGGALGGYAGGVDRKQWLLNHEKNI